MMIVKIIIVFTILSTVKPLLNTEKTIALLMKKPLLAQSSSTVTLMMKQHYMRMKLISLNNVWSNPRLEAISQYLLPRNLTGQDLARMVDKIAESAAKNKYLHRFLQQADGQDFIWLLQKIKREGARVLPDVVAYAMVLDRLTGAMRADWRILESCKQIWTNMYKPWNVLYYNNNSIRRGRTKVSQLKVFVMLKLLSFHIGVTEILKSLKNKTVDQKFWKMGVPFNIRIAKEEDVLFGNVDNARVAQILAKETPGGKENACTESKFTSICSSGNSINFHIALPLEWADLYQTWNMAFVTNFEDWPYYLAKLLIPSVSDYQNNPEGYLYARILALYSHLNWIMMDYLYQGTSPHLNWYNVSLSRIWGRANKASAEDYQLERPKCQ
jgi:hypothetical protein